MSTLTERSRRGKPFFLLLSGDRAAGKSTICERLAQAARRSGLAAGGIACPAVFGPDGVKTGCRGRSVASGDEWELGSTVRDLGGPRWKGWSFSEEGFRRANRAVAETLASRAGLLVVDEIGPVELRLGLGLHPSLLKLDALSAAGSARAFRIVLVVRSELLDALQLRYPGAAVLRVTPESREDDFIRARTLVFGETCPESDRDGGRLGARQGEQG